MPQRTDANPPPSVDVDVDKKYIVEVIGITEQQAQYDNSKEGDMSLVWKFFVYDMDTGISLIDSNTGLAYELWNFTNDQTFFNEKTGKKSKAREWTEALVGRALTNPEMDDLIDLGFEDALMGKRGVADLEWYLTKKTATERLRIIRLRPYKKGQKGTEPQEETLPSYPPSSRYPEPVEMPAPVTQTKERTPAERAAARARLGLDDAA